MKTIIATAAVALAAITALSACGQQETGQDRIVRQPADGKVTEDDFYDEDGDLNVNLTEADFIADLQDLDSVERADMCSILDGLQTDADYDSFIDTMTNAGYSNDQILNMHSALLTVCPASAAPQTPITAPPATPPPAYTPPPVPQLAPTYGSSSDQDCPDVGHEVWVGSYDPDNLDADGDGWGCELQGTIDDYRSEVDDVLSDLDPDSPYYGDADDLYSSLDDVQDPDDLDDFEGELDDLRSEIEDYDE